MTAKAYIHPSNEYDEDGDRKMPVVEDLLFYRDGNWWKPPKITGPEIARVLFARQMAVDFIHFADCLGMMDEDAQEECSNPLSRVVSAMPAEHGIMEITFLKYIEDSACVRHRAT